jgi:4-diphosphocytidyl-2-C-methyl-D-erythritol kinase
MILQPLGNELVVWAPAKVNLFLEVLGKRSDGYHDIETLMVAVTLFDTLRFKEEESGIIRLHCTDPNLSTGEDNLIGKAARLLLEQLGCAKGVTIHLRKRIPMAAGLAGGSSDAAATLVALNRLWQLTLSQEELARLGARLGSDIAFFLTPPAAWCSGRGEIVKPLTLGSPLWMVLVCPPFGLGTAEVYRHVRVPAQPRTGDALRQSIQLGEPEVIGQLLHNRLQEPAEELRPELTVLLEVLARENPAGRLMSGSGTTLFALCRDCQEGRRLVHHLRRHPQLPPGTRTFLVRSLA